MPIPPPRPPIRLPEWALPPGVTPLQVPVPPRRDPKRRRRWLIGALVFCIGLPVVAALGLLLYAQSLRTDLPDIYMLQQEALASSSTAYTADGAVLARYHHLHRRWVPLSAVSKNITDALIATEDRRYYEHAGVDWKRFFGSAYFTARGKTQGGSTITMQLARNVFPEEVGNDQSVTRKLKEIMTARALEKAYSKAEILEMYLNTMPFGFNAFGIEAASQVYFSKPAADVSVPEAALLVAMLKGTTRYNPKRNPGLALERRNLVLRRMEENGALPEGAAVYTASDLGLRFNTPDPHESPAPYFADFVAGWVQAWCASRGCDLRRDGLKIYTTLDTRLQTLAEEAILPEADGLQAVADYEWSHAGGTVGSVAAARTNDPFGYFWRTRTRVVDSYYRDTDRFRALVRGGQSEADALRTLRADAAFSDSLRRVKTHLEMGFIAIEPATGYVRAYLGGRDYALNEYDHVGQARRQPGSTFKPFVYTAAIDWGMRPDDRLQDVVKTYGSGANAWRPTNAGGGASGASLTLRQGLTYSKNTISAQIVNQIGPGYVARIARRMGITSELREVPSLALGTSEVTLLELASGYTTLAAGGVHHVPIVVTRIEDREGRVIGEFGPTAERSIGAGVAYTVLDMMRGVIEQGTGARLKRNYGLRGDLAGKTGTTQQNADGWFMVMHPRLVMGAWVGFDDRRIAFRSMQWGQGGAGALSLVGRFMQHLQRSDLALPDTERFHAPPGYEVLPFFRDESYREPDSSAWRLPDNFFEANERDPEWEKYEQRHDRDARPADVVPFQSASEKPEAGEIRPPQHLRMSRPAPASTPPPAPVPPSAPPPPPATRTSPNPRPSGTPAAGTPAAGTPSEANPAPLEPTRRRPPARTPVPALPPPDGGNASGQPPPDGGQG